jgi:hypothetical protein
MAENPDKAIELKKPFRVFYRNDDINETPLVGFETGPDGKAIISEVTLVNYGASVTHTWAIGKYLDYNDPGNLWDKFVRKEMETNL